MAASGGPTSPGVPTPAAPGTPSNGPVPPGSSGRPGSSRRSAILIPVVAIVVVVAIVAGLILTGILPLSSTPGTSAPQSFSASRQAAQTAADGAAGGPWNLLLVTGFASLGTFNSTPANVTGLAGALSGTTCTFAASGMPTAKLTATAVGNVSQGAAGIWLFLFSNHSGATLLVASSAGSTTVVGTVSGSGCDLAAAGFTSIPAGGLIDSSTASATADSSGGYGFLALHPEANATWVLLGGFTTGGISIGPVWLVEYLTCSLSGPGPASGAAFEAILSASSGTVLLARSMSINCPSAAGSTTSIGQMLALGPPTESAVGSQFWYNWTILAAAGGLTWSDTILKLTTPAGGTVAVPTGSTFTVVSLSGSVVATFDLATSAWSGQSDTVITSTETLDLAITENLAGMNDDLQVQGTGAFSGAVVEAIP